MCLLPTIGTHRCGAPWQTHRGASLSLRAEVERPLRMRGSAGALMERHASLRATGRSKVSVRAANCIVHDITFADAAKATLFSLLQRKYHPAKPASFGLYFFGLAATDFAYRLRRSGEF